MLRVLSVMDLHPVIAHFVLLIFGEMAMSVKSVLQNAPVVNTRFLNVLHILI